MKKIVLMEESDRDAFYRFCQATESIETDKDAFLKAARLERHESGSKLTGEQQYWLAIVRTWAGVIVLVAICVLIACLK